MRRDGTASLWRVGGPLLVWVATRAPVYLLLDHRNPHRGDVTTYQGWLRFFVHGAFPVADARWQYPPGAAAVLTLPHLLPGSYIGSLYRTLLLSDLAITVLLLVMGSKRGSLLGCWLWVLGLPVLGSTPLGRFDLFPTLCAVAALSLANSRYGLGVFAGLGAAIKVWPVVTIFAARRGCGRSVLLTAMFVAGAVVAVYLAFTTNSLGFFSNQAGRGLEIESVAAVPFLWLHRMGFWHGIQLREYGAVELVGSGVATVSAILVGATVVAMVLVAVWRHRSDWTAEHGVDAALVATMLLVTTSRVLSPQFLIWLLGIASCALCSPRTSQRTSAALLSVALVLTLVDFPILFHHLRTYGMAAIVVVTLRNTALVAANCVGCIGLWRASRADAAADRPATADRTASVTA